MADFYLDHDMSIHLAPPLRSLGHSAVTAKDRGLERAHDGLQILVATRQAEILVSHNGKHFKTLHLAWLAWSQEWGIARQHGGILILEHGIVLEHLQRLEDFLQLGWNAANSLHEWRAGYWRPFP